MPRPVPDVDLKLMYRIRKPHMEFPFGVAGCCARQVREGFGSGACRNNVFVERLWRYKEVNLRAHACVSGARAGIGRYPTLNDNRRPHHCLAGKPRTKPISMRQRPKRRRHNQGGKPLGERPEPVQINRATSDRTPERADARPPGLGWAGATNPPAFLETEGAKDPVPRTCRRPRGRRCGSRRRTSAGAVPRCRG